MYFQTSSLRDSAEFPHLIPIIILLASGCGKISFNVLGLLSSKTTSECHLEPKAVNWIRIGIVSLPFSVSLHTTMIGCFFPPTHSMNPSSSNSLRRIERTLGVRPGIDSKILLKRTILRKPISLRINMVHFFPSTPKLVFIGHWMNLTCGKITPSSSLLVNFDCWSSVNCDNYTYDPLHLYKLYFVY